MKDAVAALLPHDPAKREQHDAIVKDILAALPLNRATQGQGFGLSVSILITAAAQQLIDGMGHDGALLFADDFGRDVERLIAAKAMERVNDKTVRAEEVMSIMKSALIVASKRNKLPPRAI